VQRFFTLTVSGLVTGAIYSIMASGLVLAYQTSGIFNFGHGAVAFAVAYFYFQIHTGQGMDWVPALILSVFVFAPLLGLLLDRILLRRLAAAPVYARIVGTIGLVIALPAFVQWIGEVFGEVVFGLGLQSAREARTTGETPGIGPERAVFRPFDIVIDSNQIAIFVAAAVCAVVLWYILRHTRLGLAMRVVVDRRELAGLRGINDARTSQAAWILTMMLAGLAGILITPIFQLGDYLYTGVVFASLFAIALSGLRSIPIAFAGGLVLGVMQNLVAGYANDLLPPAIAGLSGLKASIPYLATLLVLFVQAGRVQGREAGTVADERPPRDHREGLSPLRRRLPWAIFTVLLAAFSFQWFGAGWAQADTYEAGIIAKGLVTGLIFLSFVVVTGIGGMVSLAQGTFVIAGGFAAGYALELRWPDWVPFVADDGSPNFLWALLAAALVAATIGAVISVLVRRLGALYLALGTLVLAFFTHATFFDYEPIGRSSLGWFIPAPSLDLPVVNEIADVILPGSPGGLDFRLTHHQVLLGFVAFGAFTLLIHSLSRSQTGRAMLAVRSSEVASQTSGISPAKQKMMLFALSAAIAGVGGALFGMINITITRGSAPPVLALIWLTVAVTFGIRRPGGALLAGLAFACSQQIFSWLGGDVIGGEDFTTVTTSPFFTPILFGLGAINLAKNPDGLLALVGRERSEKRLERERKARIAAAEAAIEGKDVVEDTDEPVAAPVNVEGTALALDRVVAGYGEVEVLHGVSLSVRPGEIVALLGANGAGKSTVCGVAAGAIAPTSGRVVLTEEDVTAHAAYQRAREGLLLVPEARGIFPGLSVEENLRVLLSEDEMEQAYARFPILGERRDQLAGLLSGGEQQMLSLAPALAKPPKVFIADEPTLGLAPLAAEIVVQAIRDLKELGSAVLLVEEKAREVMALADTVAFMELGRIVWSGPRDEADAERLAAGYLGATSTDPA
jgi:ABC-type branched-subunit amino acid transport system ATPase component/branched-subunit amino acid ABC-type transport system permease component